MSNHSKTETRIAQLAASIHKSTTKVDQFLNSKNLPTPSFDVDGPVDFGIAPEEHRDVEDARVEAIESAMELIDLLQGPVALLRPFGLNGTSLQAISRLGIAQKVPVHGEITYVELAKQCDIYEPDLRRILRFAMVYHRLFREPRAGIVVHSAASRQLAEEPMLRDGLWMLGENFTAASARTVDALLLFKSQEPQHTGVALVNGGDKSMYDDMQARPELAKRFASAMTGFATIAHHPAGRTRPPTRILNTYPWAGLGKATIVDIGGSRGADSFLIGAKFPDLEFVVQDLPQMIAGAEQAIPPTLKGRVRFMPYSFFSPQTVVADVYLIKQCFHNWNDQYCIRIIKNQIPVLRPGAKIVVSDSVVPEPGTMGEMAERTVRAFDLMMLTNTNGREREKADWIRLFKQADPRFELTRIETLGKPGEVAPSNGIIEVVWKG